MIQHSKSMQALAAPGRPAIMTNTRAALPCGCSVYVGIRDDTLEAAAASVPCSPEHDHVARHVTLLRESFVDTPENVSTRPMVEIGDELLAEAARFYGLPTEPEAAAA